MSFKKLCWPRVAVVGFGAAWVGLPLPASGAMVARFRTVMGDFDVQLFAARMPRTVANFVAYANAGKYDGTAIHRASNTTDTVGGPLRDFVIQGGGYSFTDASPTIQSAAVATNAAIPDEPGGGVPGPSNLRGTIGMAKSGPNTVKSQWFINQGNNSFLDNPARADGGFSAFGAVLGNGMTVVDAIGQLPLPPSFGFSISAPFSDLPLRNFSGSSVNDIKVANTVTVNSVQVLTFPTGDFNLDGAVTSADAAILSAHLGLQTGALLTDGDVDEDGDVDAIDLAIWQAHGALAVVNFAVNPTSKDYTAQFTSEEGKNYALQYAGEAASGLTPWTAVPGQGNRAGKAVVTTVTGNVGALIAPNGLLSDTKRVFFRVVRLP